MEIQDDHKIQTESAIMDNLENRAYELNPLDNLQNIQIKMDEGTDLHKSINDELMYDNEIFADVITKMNAYIHKSKEVMVKTSILIDEWQIFNDFFSLIEKYQINFTNEDFVVVNRALKLFIDATEIVNPNDMFTKNLDDAKQIFYLYFDLINSNIIKNYLKNDQIYNYLKISYRICISRIFIVMRYTAYHANLDLNDLQRPINCIELLSLILNYVRTYFESSDFISNPSPTDASIISSYILQFIIYYTEDTIMVSDLIQVGSLEMIVNGLTMTIKTTKVQYDLQEYLIAIISTIGVHDDGLKELTALNTVDVIKSFLSNNVDNDLNTLAYVTLALLSTPEQIKKDGKYVNLVLDTLLKMISDASISDNFHTGNNYLLSELLIVFVKLFNDDSTLDYIMNYSKIDLHTSSSVDFFINLLINYHSKVENDDPRKQMVCTAIVNILWSISFQNKYKLKLKSYNIKFKELIQNLTKATDETIPPNQYVPNYIENIKKAAEGLLFNIDEPMEQVDSAITIPDENKKPIIMISYSHKNSDFCKELYNEILKRGYDVWIDFKFLKTGDLWETIAAAMKKANLIICLISEEYCKSKSCRLESTYALDKLQATKTVIPVVLQEHILPDWLEIRITVLKYVRFHDVKQLEDDKLSELIDMIEHSLSSTTDLIAHSIVSSEPHKPMTIPIAKSNELILNTTNFLPINSDQLLQTKLENEDISSQNDPVLCITTNENLYLEKPIEQWNKTDIYQWFQHNEIIPELRDLCNFNDGYELLDYADILLDTKKLQYKTYYDEFLKCTRNNVNKRPLLLHEFTKFTNALRKLQILYEKWGNLKSEQNTNTNIHSN